jgi:hypothetical protein
MVKKNSSKAPLKNETLLIVLLAWKFDFDKSCNEYFGIYISFSFEVALK